MRRLEWKEKASSDLFHRSHETTPVRIFGNSLGRCRLEASLHLGMSRNVALFISRAGSLRLTSYGNKVVKTIGWKPKLCGLC